MGRSSASSRISVDALFARDVFGNAIVPLEVASALVATFQDDTIQPVLE
jgi:hypothetical protein